jgi:ribosomal peptide maturation radical SAM protein 1
MLRVINQPSAGLQDDREPLFSASPEDCVALVFMPWGAITRGSIGLGILKRCVQRLGVRADVHYLNTRFAAMLGLEFYQNVSDGEPLLPEWFFSHVLFGSHGLGLIENSWDDLARSRYSPMVKDSMSRGGWTEAKCEEVTGVIIPKYIEECLTTIDWSKYKVVGFSSTFAQTLASLLLSSRIKERHPEVKIVFGGANAESEMGFELIKAFDWIDYVVHGEAEQTFPRLIKNVLTGRYFDKLPGVSMRNGTDVVAAYDSAAALNDLNESPAPDYTDYIKEVERLGINKRLPVFLSFESSRGCWWGAKAHCTFCGLNGNTMAFRKKSPDRVYEEIVSIAKEYRCLSLDAVDNIMDLGYMDTLLPRLAEADLDLSLFYEVKASMSREQVRRLAAAGVNRIQPGIESLNTDLLRLMRKGMTAGQNIQLLKWCSEYGITPSWNILYGFPGELADQYSDCPRIIRLIMHLQPPDSVCPVVFERFSPYHFDRGKFRLSLEPLGYYKLLYPEGIVDLNRIAYFFEGQWEGAPADMQEYIGPVRKAVDLWKQTWDEKSVFFNYVKGPGFVTLFDNRPLSPGGKSATRRMKLNDIQASIFLFCDQIQSFPTIQRMLDATYKPAPAAEQTQALLDQFVQNGLMFREDERYLSLAVRKKKQPLRESGPASPSGHEFDV